MEQARGEILGELQRSCAAHQSGCACDRHPRRGRRPGRAHRRWLADAHGSQPSADHGARYTYLRMADVARICLETRGLSTLGSPAQLIERAMHTTSDFPNVLAELFNKNLIHDHAHAFAGGAAVPLVDGGRLPVASTSWTSATGRCSRRSTRRAKSISARSAIRRWLELQGEQLRQGLHDQFPGVDE